MISRFLKFFVLTVIIVISVACTSLSNVNIDVLRPATYSVDPYITSVVVVDNSLPYRNENVHLVTNMNDTIAVIDTIWVDNYGKIVTASMAEALKSSAFFDSVYYHPLPLKNNQMLSSTGRLTYPKIDSLCRAYNAQAVISLEAYLYQSKLDFVDQGESFYLTLDVNSQIYWTMSRFDGMLMDAYVQKDTVFWDFLSSSESRQSSGLPGTRDAIETLGWHMGQNAVKRVAPYWEKVKRFYFTGGNYLFLRGADLFKANNLEEAARVWYYIYQNGSKRDKARAAFNLAFSYELRGNFPEAVAWGDISYQLYENLGFFSVSYEEKNISKLYYLELAMRQRQKIKLDEQLGAGN